MVRDAAVAYTDEQQKLVFEADDAEVVATEIFLTWAAKAIGFVIGHHLFQRWCRAIWHHH